VLSSNRDDSFIKLHEAFSVLFAARVRIVRMLVCLSRNENNNGFDLVGLNFFSLEYRRVAFFFILLLYLVSSLGCLFSELMKYLHIARHLAAKTGTNLTVLI
jgi:hypothetical protein